MDIDLKDLKNEIKKYLKDSDSSGITPKDIRINLEKHFNCEYKNY